LGLTFGRIRALGDRNSPMVKSFNTGGLYPYLKMLKEQQSKSCTQNGVRFGGSRYGLFHLFWHKEIREVMVLKNNKGHR